VDRLARRALDWPIFPEGEARLLVAVSGGADSVFLARALAGASQKRAPRSCRKCAWTLILAHVHHGLRGADADEDQRFVETLATELGLPCLTARIDPSQLTPPPPSPTPPLPTPRSQLTTQPPQLSGSAHCPLTTDHSLSHNSQLTTHNSSLEDRLRQARWGILAALARAQDCDAIVTAHHQDDLAETLLLQAIRGAGLTGLGSMRPRGEWEEVPVLRPMLGIRRAQIREALAADGAAWREDATNADPRFKRNWLRAEILPLLEARDPGCVAALARTALVCGEEADELLRQGAALLERARPPAAAYIAAQPAKDEEQILASAQVFAKAQALDWRILSEAPAVIRRHALRQWIAQIRQSPLAPAAEALRDLERAACAASKDGTERMVDSIPSLLAWTDGRWILAGPAEIFSRAAAGKTSRAGASRILKDLIFRWLADWKSLWGIPILMRDAQESVEVPILLPSRGARAAKRLPMHPLLARIRLQILDAALLPADWRERWRAALKSGRRAVFDADEIEGRLILRAVSLKSDRLALEHKGGRKSAAAILAESGVPALLRPHIPILCDVRGPLWLFPFRRAARAFATPQTRRVLVFDLDIDADFAADEGAPPISPQPAL